MRKFVLVFLIFSLLLAHRAGADDSAEKTVYIGFRDGTLISIDNDSLKLNPLNIAKIISKKVNLNDAVFLYLNYKTPNITVIFGEIWRPDNGGKLALLDDAYPNFIDKNYNQSLLVITPPGHYSNKLPTESRNGLVTWAKQAKHGNLIANFETFSQGIINKLPESYHDTSGKVCLLGNSRFGFFALSSAPFLIPKNSQPVFILIAPVINPLSLDEFKGVTFDYEISREYLDKSIIFAGTKLVDPRVDEKNLFKLASSLSDQKIFLDVLPGEGHSYYPSVDMINFYKKECLN
jgi:hypothetical protein